MNNEERIKNWVKENYSDGMEVYCDYSDEIPESEITKIIESKNPLETMYEYLDEIYQATVWTMEDETFQEMLRDLDIDEEDDNIDDFRDIFLEYFFVNIPYDHFLSQDICCDIFVDSGDYDSDLSCNCIYPHYYGDSSLKCKDIANESCVVWLAKKQGYTKKELFNSLFRSTAESKLLKSIERELENCSSSSNSLVVLKKYTLKELIEMKDMKDMKDMKSVTIDENATIGLFDRWNGAGGCMEIELEKELIIPMENIHEIIPDANVRYSVRDVYGVTDRFWE